MGAAVAETVVLDRIGLRLEILRSPLQLSLYDLKGRLVCRTLAGGWWFRAPEGIWSAITDVEEASPIAGGGISLICENGLGFRARIRLEPRAEGLVKIRFEPFEPASEIKVEFAARSRSPEGFFGLGEVWNGTLNQRGKRVRMWVENGTPDRCAYVPFVISTAGYGVFVDEYRDGFFDFCVSSPDRWSFSFKNRALDFYVLAGPLPKDVVRQYARLTGRPALPPEWALLPWKWRDRIESDREVYADVSGMRKADIPLGVVWVDRPWERYGTNSFEFDPAVFRDPQRMAADLAKDGVRLLVWTSPFTNPGVPNFETAKARGYLVNGPDGKPLQMGGGYYIDLTNPAAYGWWKDEIKKVIRIGVAGMKLDRGQDIPPHARFADGSTGAEMHNKYALLYCKVVYDAFNEEMPGDFAMLPRPGCAGSQSYTNGKWPGDLSASFDMLSGLPAAVIAGQSAGLCGFSIWGSDIGGFEARPNEECTIRWAQFGAFCPIMELVGKDARDSRNPENFSPRMREIYRYYATLHTELQPYAYSLAIESSETGVPIMRPLFLEFPNDQTAMLRSLEYMYGDSILVAPVCERATAREVYLPAGKWFDYWTGASIPGPTTLKSYPCPLECMPIFVKAGAIIPMLVSNSVTGHGGPYSRGAWTLLVYPSDRSSAVVRTKTAAARLDCAQNSEGVAISCRDLPKLAILRVKMGAKPKSVNVDGKPVAALLREGDLSKVASGWWHDSAKGWLIVKPGRAFKSVRAIAAATAPTGRRAIKGGKP